MNAGNALNLQRELTKWLGSGNKATKVNFKDVGEERRLKFDKNTLLGSVSNGARVYLGTFRKHITNEQQLVAIKQVQYNNDDEYRRTYREVENLQQLNHTNVVRYLFADKYDDYIINIMFIALELCRGSLVDMFVHKRDVFKKPFNLKSLVPCDDWWFKKTILLGIANGLDYVHSQRFIHRDLKPQNILVQEDSNNVHGFKAVLCDFEFTRKLKDGQSVLSVSQGAVGSQGWMAKEVLTSTERTRLTPAIDVFAYGCIVHYVLSENRDKQFIHPFGSDIRRDNSILIGKRFSYISLNLTPIYDSSDDDSSDDASSDTQDYAYLGDAIVADMLVDACLSNKPFLRPLASELLTHPYFWNYDRKMLCCENMFNTFKHDFQRSPLIKSMEQTWQELTRPEFQFFSQIPEAFEYYKLHRMSINKTIPPDNVISTIYNSMMRFTRNLQQHYHEAVKMYPPLTDDIESGDNETLGEYFFESIPMSFPVIYLFHKLHENSKLTAKKPSTSREMNVHRLLHKTLKTLHDKHDAL